MGAEPVFTRVFGVLDESISDLLVHGEDFTAVARDTRRILRYLSPESHLGYRKVRRGNEADGGYVCMTISRE